MQLFADEKPLLWQWKANIEHYLAHLRLQVHAGVQPRPVTEGFGFLGFRLFPEYRRLKKRKGIHYQRHLKKMLSDYENGAMLQDEVLDSVMAWNNHVGYGNTVGLRKRMFAVLPDELTQEARRRFLRILMRRTQ